MAAVWLLLGKTRYPAKFLETFAGKSWVTEVPFDLTIDVLLDLLRDPDSHLQHLAAEGPQDVAGFEHIAGESRVIRDAVGRAKRAAVRGVSILLLGESGTGEHLFARAAVAEQQDRNASQGRSLRAADGVSNHAALAGNVLEPGDVLRVFRRQML